MMVDFFFRGKNDMIPMKWKQMTPSTCLNRWGRYLSMKKPLPATIINDLRAGDQTAFFLVYEQYKSLLYFVIMSIVKHKEDAEDLLQDTFIKIMQNIDTLDQISRFKSWAAMIARNLSLNHLKAKKNLVFLDEDVFELIKTDDTYFPFLQDFQDHLSQVENLVIAYKIVYEFTFDEISDLLHTPRSTVYKTYQEALAKLRKTYRGKEK